MGEEGEDDKDDSGGDDDDDEEMGLYETEEVVQERFEQHDMTGNENHDGENKTNDKCLPPLHSTFRGL